MKWTDLLPGIIAFGITAVAIPVLIPMLQRHNARQTEREYGPKSHLKKSGTPTMGGIGILLGILAAGLISAPRHPGIWPILLLTLGFGAVGFYDDFLKVILRRSDGLKAKQKLLLEAVITAAFLVVIKLMHVPLEMRVPFTAGKMVSFGWFAYPFLFLVVLATVNGVNFTDGLDGLASSVTAAVAIFFGVAAILVKSDIVPMPFAVLLALLAFLLYNTYPAKIFMGDTGSLALGGFVAATAYMLQMPLYIIIVGFVYAFELLSVAMQVTYFKLTHGKRIFPMTPIHHTFELWKWSEPRIVALFTIVTAMLAAFALIGLF